MTASSRSKIPLPAIYMVELDNIRCETKTSKASRVMDSRACSATWCGVGEGVYRNQRTLMLSSMRQLNRLRSRGNRRLDDVAQELAMEKELPGLRLITISRSGVHRGERVKANKTLPFIEKKETGKKRMKRKRNRFA